MLSIVKQAVYNAGDAILDIYHSGDFEVDIKSDNSPLTKADKESNRIICEALQHHFPDIPVISEESKMLPYSERREYTMAWVIDPLDGTKEFIKRNGEFTVNVALIENGHPVLGIVYVPVSREMYVAEQGKGAFLEKAENIHALKVSSFELSDRGLKIVASRSHLNPETQSFIDAFQAPETVSKGSALKFMLIASGAADLYPRIAPTMEWDTAAAQCIVEEAGGSVVHFETRLPLTYNKESLLNPSFLASGKFS